MSGHSKWSTIKHKKGAADAKRGKLFSLVAKQIRAATKAGNSGDPQFNPTLRTALEKARAANMPKDKIQKAIDKGLGKGSTGQQIHEIVYEGYGPHGVGIIAVAFTDNVQRTASEVKFIFSRHGGSLGGPNSVTFMFQRSPEGEYRPTMPMTLEPTGQEQVQELVDALLENEDIDDVYTAVELEAASSSD